MGDKPRKHSDNSFCQDRLKQWLKAYSERVLRWLEDYNPPQLLAAISRYALE